MFFFDLSLPENKNKKYKSQPTTKVFMVRTDTFLKVNYEPVKDCRL